MQTPQPITSYNTKLQAYTKAANSLNKKIKRIMSFRLLSMLFTFLLFIYGISSNQPIALYASGALLIVFLILLQWQNKEENKLKILKAHVLVYNEEVQFLEKGILPEPNGAEYIDTQHRFTYDLDVFGSHSLYHYINRTKTHLGELQLVKMLNEQSYNDIHQKQEILKELGQDPDWIKKMQAHAYLCFETKENVDRLFLWLGNKEVNVPKWLNFYSKIAFLPILVLLVLQFTTALEVSNILIFVFIFHMILSGSIKKRNQSLERGVDYMGNHIQQYAILFQNLEEKTFQSEGLQKLQSTILKEGSFKASENLFSLSNIFKRFENIQNLFGNVILNGLFLYHIKSLTQLENWHDKHNHHLKEQLETWALFESYMSLALFHINHPQFVFPTISETEIEWEGIGHPLMSPTNMVTNDVSFSTPPFVILTGSNMSGKSTFLRSVGINYLLFSLGAPVFAKKAVLKPLPLYVSMRQTDSLSDNESYFYAEIKRLKSIKDALSEKPHFILLDEILRGTNSDDKTNGAIGLLEQLQQMEVHGVIATHDLEVCEMAGTHPDFYINYCFESQIIDDDLYFDYILRKGICKNRSATFLMKKMGILA